MYLWQQLGWGWGSPVSYLFKLDARTTSLNVLDCCAQLAREPFDAPILLPRSEDRIFVKRQLVSASSLTNLLASFAEDIYAITSQGDLAFGPTQVFDGRTGQSIYHLPVTTTVKAVSGDDDKLFMFDPATGQLVYQLVALYTEALPIADSQTITTIEDIPVPFVLTGRDPDNEPVMFRITVSPNHGTLVGTPPNLTYLPGTNYFGTDSFNFTTFDGIATSAVATVSISITPVNDSPAAQDQMIQVVVNHAKRIKLLASDVEGSPLTYEIFQEPLHGTISGTPPDMVYTPSADYVGADRLVFKVNDGELDSSPATISFTIHFPICAPPPAASSVGGLEMVMPMIVQVEIKECCETAVHSVSVKSAKASSWGPPTQWTLANQPISSCRISR